MPQLGIEPEQTLITRAKIVTDSASKRNKSGLPAPLYDGPIFDSDSHIQERDFSFMPDYLPKRFHDKWLVDSRYDAEGEYSLFLGDHKVDNTEIADGVVFPPGKLHEWLAAISTGNEIDVRIPIAPDMYSLEGRIEKLDEFGVESALIFPGLMNSIPGWLKVFGERERFWEAPCAVLHAYNRYILDEWTFNYRDRLYSAPLLALWDLDWAVAEAKWLVENGCRLVTLPMGPGPEGRPPADSYYDPLWSILNEAGVLVSYHVSDASFLHGLVRQWGEEPLLNRRKGQSAWQWMFTFSEIPVMMTMSSFIYANFFDRFPRLRMVSVENGAEWVPRFLHKMDKMRGMARAGYWSHGQMKERPSTVFKRHCFAVAYPEDNVRKIIDEIGCADPILMGSDYPHPEGVATPREFVEESLGGLSLAEAERVMYANGRRMMPKAA
jgi:predicted TIM-barrel fold metal-dependent hydrolase